MRPEAKASGWLQSALTTAHVLSMGQQVLFFLVECGIVRFLCAMCVFDVRASSSPPCYLCAKFCFCLSRPRLLASPRRKIAYSNSQSITQSLIQLISCATTKAFALESKKIVCGTYHICVLPTPGAPQNSVIFPSGTPPPSSTSNCSANVTIGSWSWALCSKSKAVTSASCSLFESRTSCSSSTASFTSIPSSTSTHMTLSVYRYTRLLFSLCPW